MAEALPPSARSRVALEMTDAAAEGRFVLQVCLACLAVQYPPREMCGQCLAVELQWRDQSGLGKLLATTELAHSLAPYFQSRLPWRIGMIHLDTGPVVIAHMHGQSSEISARVRVAALLDEAGRAVLVCSQEESNV